MPQFHSVDKTSQPLGPLPLFGVGHQALAKPALDLVFPCCLGTFTVFFRPFLPTGLVFFANHLGRGCRSDQVVEDLGKLVFKALGLAILSISAQALVHSRINLEGQGASRCPLVLRLLKPWPGEVGFPSGAWASFGRWGDGSLFRRSAVPFGAGKAGAKGIPKDLGKASFDAANGVGTIYSPKVTLNNSEIIFDEFAVGTSKGFIGVGADGAAELVGPLKKMLSYAQSQGAKTITLRGRYASPEGSMLGTGSINNVNQNFSFSFPATKDGLKEFLKGIGK